MESVFIKCRNIKADIRKQIPIRKLKNGLNRKFAAESVFKKQYRSIESQFERRSSPLFLTVFVCHEFEMAADDRIRRKSSFETDQCLLTTIPFNKSLISSFKTLLAVIFSIFSSILIILGSVMFRHFPI